MAQGSRWREDVLDALAAPITPRNLAFLATWQRHEGGHTNNEAAWNWLNTTRKYAGASGAINSVGVQRYDSYAHGIGATVQTILAIAPNVVAGLKSGNLKTAGVVNDLSVWLTGQGASGNAHGVSYANKILGSSAKSEEGFSQHQSQGESGQTNETSSRTAAVAAAAPTDFLHLGNTSLPGLPGGAGAPPGSAYIGAPQQQSPQQTWQLITSQPYVSPDTQALLPQQ